MTTRIAALASLIGAACLTGSGTTVSPALAQAPAHPPASSGPTSGPTGHGMHGGMGQQAPGSAQGSGQGTSMGGKQTTTSQGSGQATSQGMSTGGGMRMMDGMGPMMQSMMSEMMVSGMGPMSGLHRMMVVRPEGALAFLKTELKIGPDQEQVWSSFAEAARQATSKVRAAAPPASVMSQGWPAVLEAREKLLVVQLEAVRALRPAAAALYAALTPDQRKTADELLVGSMGMR